MARRKGFDPEEVLDKAMDAFWAEGYGGTSVQDLVERTGIHRASLYGTFGDKQGLFLAAVDRYDRVIARGLLQLLEATGSGRRAIRRFFLAKVTNADRAGRPPGCLVTNSAIERSPHDRRAAAKVEASLSRMEEAFYRALMRACDSGELHGVRNLRGLARFLTNAAQGLSVMARAGYPRAALMDIAEVTLSVLD